jgi:hypothetical protein
VEFMDEIALLRNSYHGRLDFQTKCLKNSKGTGGAVNTTQTLKNQDAMCWPRVTAIRVSSACDGARHLAGRPESN